MIFPAEMRLSRVTKPSFLPEMVEVGSGNFFTRNISDPIDFIPASDLIEIETVASLKPVGTFASQPTVFGSCFSEPHEMLGKIFSFGIPATEMDKGLSTPIYSTFIFVAETVRDGCAT